jgi:hypothetical protein
MSYVVPTVPTTLWQKLVRLVYEKKRFESQVKVVLLLLPFVYTDDCSQKEKTTKQ